MQHYEEFVGVDTMDTGLLTLFQEMGEDCPLIHVLKMCNQSIIAPVINKLKTHLGMVLPYNSVRRGWSICIYFHNERLVGECE